MAAALARAEILAPAAASRALQFVHPLVRRAVYADIAPADRARLHARAAELLSQRPAGTDSAAVHLLHTDPVGNPDVVERLRDAARAAIARGAPETAVEASSAHRTIRRPTRATLTMTLSNGAKATKAARILRPRR